MFSLVSLSRWLTMGPQALAYVDPRIAQAGDPWTGLKGCAG